MSKYFDPLKVFIPNADELGHKIGEYLPKLGKLVLEAGKKHKLIPEEMDSLPASVQKVLPELLKMAGGGIEIPRDKLPNGHIGDIVHDYLNEIVDAMGRGAADHLKAAGDKPDAKGDAAKAPAKPDGAPVEPKARKGYVTEGIWYPADCTHAKRPWGGKGQKAPDDITLEEALARGHGYCQRCIRDLAEAAKPDAKAEPKEDQQTAAPKEHPLPTADHTLFDLWQSLRDEDALEHDGDVMQYRGSWDEFVRRTEHDPELRGKFLLAFTRRGTYEQFKRLVLHSKADHWHHHLDHLLGTSKPSASYLKRKADEEREQWERAVKGITAWFKRGNVEGQKAIDQDKAELAALKARYHGTSGRSSVGWFVTIVSLAILSGAIYVIATAS